MTLTELSKTITRYRFTFTSEKELQNGIATALIKEKIPHLREFVLNVTDRPDFMLYDGIVIEVKIKGSLADLLRQATRYAGYDQVTGILVVGTPHWLSRIPATLAGKPVRALRLIGSML
jgi:hypothetical protein